MEVVLFICTIFRFFNRSFRVKPSKTPVAPLVAAARIEKSFACGIEPEKQEDPCTFDSPNRFVAANQFVVQYTAVGHSNGAYGADVQTCTPG